MKKIGKFIALALGTLVLLLLIGTVALKIFYPSEKIKARLLLELTHRLNREVTMDHVSLGLINGLEVENLRISESKTFAQGTFVSVQNLGVRIRLLPLLAKRVEIDTLILTGPIISVVRSADGKTFNFSDLIPSTATARTTVAEAQCQGLVPCAYAAPGEPQASATPVNLQISKLEIRNGQVHFADHSPAHQNADIEELNLKIGGFSLADFFNATLRAKIRTMGMNILAQATGKLDLKTAVVQLTNATLSIGDSKIEASGDITNYSASVPTINIKIVVDALTPASFGTLATLPPGVAWSGVAKGNVDLKGDLDHLDLGGNLHADDVQLRYGKMFQKPAKVPFSLSFNGNVVGKSTADIREWGLKLASLSATGNARVEGLAQKLPSLSLHLVTNDFSVPDVLALLPGVMPAGTKVQGPAKISADVVGTPASYKATAKLAGQDLVITSSDTFKKPAGMPFEATFKGESVQSGQRLNIESLLLVLGRIQMTLSGQTMAQGQDSRLALALHSNDFPLDELPKLLPAAAGYQFSGPGHLEMKIGNLMSAPSVDGTLTLHQVNIKSAAQQVQQAEGRLHFNTPNPLAQATHLSLKTDGQITAQHVHHEFYDGNALKLTWTLSDITEDLSKISGVAQFNQGPGALRNLETLAKQSKAAKLALLPIQVIQKLQRQGLFKEIGLPSLDNISFSTIHGDYAFRSGVMDIHAFDLSGKDISLGAKGTIGLAGTQPLDLHNQVTLAKGAIGGTLGQLIQDDQGRATVKYAVTGTAANPQVKLDLQEAGQKAIKKLGDDLLKGVNGNDPGKALNDIGNNLKNLFK